MSRRRWAIWLGPPLAVIAVGVLLGRFQAGAEAGGRSPAASPGACVESPVARDASGRPDLGAGVGTWWTLSERLDPAGVLVGRRLSLGHEGAANLALDLPRDAMASGPAAGVVVLTAVKAGGSRILLVSESRGCAFLVREASQLARGAILDPADGSILAHLVDRDTRTDLGTWRYAADGTGEPVLVAPPLEENPARGPTWVTDLRLDATGALLAVQSCTDEGCLTRIFSLAEGNALLARIAGDQGSMLGLADGRLLTWAKCFGLPCGVVSWDLSTGHGTVVVDPAESAAVSGDGRFLVVVADSSRRSYLRVDLQHGNARGLRGINASEHLVTGGVIGTSGLGVRPGEVGIGAPGAVPRPFDPALSEVLQ